MKLHKNPWLSIFAACGMLMLILDSRTSLSGAAAGIDLCIRTAVPSLLPFFVLSILLTASMTGKALPALRSLGKLCGIPEGAESLLVIGLLGGYPVGAQCICQTRNDGLLTDQEAHRLLGFCNNAGPAFLFGIAGSLFSSQICPWILWAIHIVSALTVGALLPEKSHRRIILAANNQVSLAQALKKSVRIMGEVCGWIILFRVFLAFCDRWFLWLLPDTLRAAMAGAIELVNGCQYLYSIPAEGARFVLCSAILAFGGLCVAMQTLTVTGALGLGWYFPGKILQCLISVILSLVSQYFLFTDAERMTDPVSLGIIISVLIVTSIPFASKLKKTVAFQRKPVYNT